MSPFEHDYPYVRAWGIYLRQDPGEATRLIRQARADRAPADACWPAEDGWMTRSALRLRALESSLSAYNLRKLDEYAEPMLPRAPTSANP